MTSFPDRSPAIGFFDREILPKWSGRRLSEITKADVRRLLDGIMRRGSPVSANRCLTSLKTWMNWCVAEDILTASPAAGVRAPAVESPRVRVLDDSEFASVWRASMTLGQYGAGVVHTANAILKSAGLPKAF